MAHPLRWLAPLLALSALPASAENRLGIWPGMSSDEVVTVLRPRCPGLVYEGGDGPPSASCRIEQADRATLVLVTFTTKGRAYYIAWHDPSDEEVANYTKRIAGELGLTGPGKVCKFYDYELSCWYGKDSSVLYAGERDSGKRFVNYIVNDRIRDEDDGPATEAPVSPEE